MIKVYSKEYENRIEWYKENDNEGFLIYHREDGPAIEWHDGTKWWYQNGRRHRTDGPAIEYENGGKEYYLNGKHYPDIKTDEEWIIFQIIN